MVLKGKPKGERPILEIPCFNTYPCTWRSFCSSWLMWPDRRSLYMGVSQNWGPLQVGGFPVGFLLKPIPKRVPCLRHSHTQKSPSGWLVAKAWLLLLPAGNYGSQGQGRVTSSKDARTSGFSRGISRHPSFCKTTQNPGETADF